MDFEKDFWSNCCSTFEEELKQFEYAARMGVEIGKYDFNVHGKSILDIGGGPVSMLLKAQNLKDGVVVDPLEYPAWTMARYSAKEIAVYVARGEDVHTLNLPQFDEVWIYNCLQHTDDPEKIIANAKALAPVLRLFEWIDLPPHPGHPQELTEASLNRWIGMQPGTVAQLNGNGCFGRAFFGTFRNESYQWKQT
jgi:SAM-dependent methyltransferase